MAERGGPTTQSGILYQNSVAALYLARLVDTRRRPAADKVAKVRVESTDHVDDIVVTFSDGHKDWVQVKESITLGNAWTKLWQDFSAQAGSGEFSPVDRLVLITSQATNLIISLQELARRARTSSDENAWLSRLTQGLFSTLGEVRSSFTPPLSDKDAYRLFVSVDVECWGLIEQMERDWVPLWVPESNLEAPLLFSTLRDMVGGKARVRDQFIAVTLLERLSSVHRVKIKDQHDNIDNYLSLVSSLLSQIELPGTGLAGPIEDMYVWPNLTESQQVLLLQSSTAPISTVADDLDDYDTESASTVDISAYPSQTVHRAVITAGAGYGKSTLLRAIGHRLAKSRILVPAIVSLPEFAESGEELLDFLYRKSRSAFNCEIDWAFYLETGRAVLLFDGLDEVQGNRVSVLRRIAALSNRYRDFPWLMAVRDPMAVCVPMGVPIYQISPLDDSGVEKVVLNYRKYGSHVDSITVRERRNIDSEFKRLSSIPFFLALLVVTCKSGQELSRGRTRLLETYLTIALTPQESRSDTKVTNSFLDLLQAAEVLAEEGLVTAGSGLSELKALTHLRSVTTLSPETLIKDLVVCGIVRRAPGWVSFSFPIVQEYLASRRLASKGADAIVERYSLLCQRPWAQTIQFALEQLPDATSAVRRLLEFPDDAFSSLLRLISRCVIHGAEVRSELKTLIGSRLGAMWLSQGSYHRNKEVGTLLADGFYCPLPKCVEELLMQGKGLSYGGGQIVSQLNNPKLTEQIFDNLIAGDSEHLLRLASLQPALDSIADTVLAKLVAASTKGEVSTEKVAEMARLVCRLDHKKVQTTLVMQQLSKALPEPIRLGVLSLRPEQFASELKRLLLDLWHRHDPEDHATSGLLTETLDRTPYATELYVQLFLEEDHDEKIERLVSALIDSRHLQRHNKIEIVSRVLSGGTAHAFTLDALSLLAIYLGEPFDVSEWMDKLSSLPATLLHTLSYLVTLVPDWRDVVRVLKRAETLPLELRLPFGGGIAFGLTYEIEIMGLFGAIGKIRRTHPASRDCSDILFDWAANLQGEQRLYALTCSAELGNTSALDLLLSEVTSNYMAYDSDKGSLSNAIHALFRHNRLIDANAIPNIIVNLVGHNAPLALVRMLARYGNEDALEALLDLRANPQVRQVHDSIEDEAERLSGQLGITLDRSPNGSLAIRKR